MPEIRPVKWFNLIPTSKQAESADYSDKIGTDDEIHASLCEINGANKPSTMWRNWLPKGNRLWTWP